MGSETLTDQASQRAHDVVDQVESKLSDVEGTVRKAADQASEQAEELAMDAQIQAIEAIKTFESFVKEKPLQAAGIAFAAGIVTAVMLRRK